MKEKVVTYLKGLKKEQWIVYLLLGALLAVFPITVLRRESSAGDIRFLVTCIPMTRPRAVFMIQEIQLFSSSAM